MTDEAATFSTQPQFREQPAREYPCEEDYSLIDASRRSLEQIAAIQAEMPNGQFTPPPNDWKHLARARQRLTEGGPLDIMMVGDSITNDTDRSGWIAKVQEAYPQASVRRTVYVRGGGSCEHYRQDGRVQKYILPMKPNVVILGGISQRDFSAFRDII
jgi:hypothetical protein